MSRDLNQIRFYCAILAIYIILNAIVWHGFTRQFYDGNATIGDLARVSFLSQYAQPKHSTNTLPKKHIAFSDWTGTPIDIITIGDSFSSGGGGGENNYYQDWMASIHNLNIMNLPCLSSKTTNLETAFTLLNSGFINHLSPRAILLQDIEREIVKKHGRAIDRNAHWPRARLASLYAEQPAISPPEHTFINSGNSKFLLYQLLYRWDDNAFFSPIYKTRLTHPLFSHPHGDILLFYGEDAENAAFASPKAIEQVVSNLNALAEKLGEKGIRLYYMPVADKLTLYRDHIANPVYPESQLFEHLRETPRAFELIDTKKILYPAIAHGEKDIYFIDDTHWTWKACKRIAEAFEWPPSENKTIRAERPLSKAYE